MTSPAGGLHTENNELLGGEGRVLWIRRHVGGITINREWRLKSFALQQRMGIKVLRATAYQSATR
jgi:hypothetical protein